MKIIRFIFPGFFLFISVKSFGNNLLLLEKGEEVSYTITKSNRDSINFLKVKATFFVKDKKRTKLFYPNNYWGQENLHNCITDIKASTDNKKLRVVKNNDTLFINHDTSISYINLEYKIHQDKGKGLHINYRYRPVIQKEYFHVLSPHLFVVPAIMEKEKIMVRIKWEGFPENYIFQNSFGSNERIQKLDNILLSDFKNAIFVGGDYRLYNILGNEGKVKFAIRGDWTVFKEGEIISVLTETFESQYEFWEEEKNNYYSVILSPITEKVSGSTNGGTGLFQSFDAISTNNEKTSIGQLVELFNHELNHNWIGTKIKNLEEEKQYWFSEGFTEYYMIKLIAKSKINNNDGEYFINKINKMIKEHFLSITKNIPNSKITYESFWNNENGLRKIPYNRGALFAFYLDKKIQSNSNNKHSLDDVMRHFLKDAMKEDQKISHSYFINTINKYLDYDVSSYFELFIEKGELIPLPLFFKAYDFDFDEKIIEFKRMGYKKDKNNKITKIRKDWDAFKAGFKIGDKIINFKKDPKITGRVTYKILRDGKEINIALTKSMRTLDIPQLKINTKNLKNLGL